MTGDGKSWMGWTSEQVTVTAADTTSLLEFSDATPVNSPCGATLDEVSLRLDTDTVKGFAATNSTDPYSVAERQMLAKLPGQVVVTNEGGPVCSIQAVAAEQVDSDTGLVIIWGVTPSTQFIQETAPAQQADAMAVIKQLAAVLETSKKLYLAALKADRVPLEGSADLASLWEVRVQSISTTANLMSFQISNSGSSSWMAWDSVPGVSSINQSLAPQALANLLYYSKRVALLAGPAPAPGQTR